MSSCSLPSYELLQKVLRATLNENHTHEAHHFLTNHPHLWKEVGHCMLYGICPTLVQTAAVVFKNYLLLHLSATPSDGWRQQILEMTQWMAVHVLSMPESSFTPLVALTETSEGNPGETMVYLKPLLEMIHRELNGSVTAPTTPLPSSSVTLPSSSTSPPFPSCCQEFIHSVVSAPREAFVEVEQPALMGLHLQLSKSVAGAPSAGLQICVSFFQSQKNLNLSNKKVQDMIVVFVERLIGLSRLPLLSTHCRPLLWASALSLTNIYLPSNLTVERSDVSSIYIRQMKIKILNLLIKQWHRWGEEDGKGANVETKQSLKSNFSSSSSVPVNLGSPRRRVLDWQEQKRVQKFSLVDQEREALEQSISHLCAKWFSELHHYLQVLDYQPLSLTGNLLWQQVYDVFEMLYYLNTSSLVGPWITQDPASNNNTSLALEQLISFSTGILRTLTKVLNPHVTGTGSNSFLMQGFNFSSNSSSFSRETDISAQSFCLQSRSSSLAPTNDLSMCSLLFAALTRLLKLWIRLLSVHSSHMSSSFVQQVAQKSLEWLQWFQAVMTSESLLAQLWNTSDGQGEPSKQNNLAEQSEPLLRFLQKFNRSSKPKIHEIVILLFQVLSCTIEYGHAFLKVEEISKFLRYGLLSSSSSSFSPSAPHFALSIIEFYASSFSTSAELNQGSGNEEEIMSLMLDEELYHRTDTPQTACLKWIIQMRQKFPIITLKVFAPLIRSCFCIKSPAGSSIWSSPRISAHAPLSSHRSTGSLFSSSSSRLLSSSSFESPSFEHFQDSRRVNHHYWDPVEFCQKNVGILLTTALLVLHRTNSKGATQILKAQLALGISLDAIVCDHLIPSLQHLLLSPVFMLRKKSSFSPPPTAHFSHPSPYTSSVPPPTSSFSEFQFAALSASSSSCSWQSWNNSSNSSSSSSSFSNLVSPSFTSLPARQAVLIGIIQFFKFFAEFRNCLSYRTRKEIASVIWTSCLIPFVKPELSCILTPGLSPASSSASSVSSSKAFGMESSSPSLLQFSSVTTAARSVLAQTASWCLQLMIHDISWKSTNDLITQHKEQKTRKSSILSDDDDDDEEEGEDKDEVREDGEDQEESSQEDEAEEEEKQKEKNTNKNDEEQRGSFSTRLSGFNYSPFSSFTSPSTVLSSSSFVSPSSSETSDQEQSPPVQSKNNHRPRIQREFARFLFHSRSKQAEWIQCMEPLVLEWFRALSSLAPSMLYQYQKPWILLLLTKLVGEVPWTALTWQQCSSMNPDLTHLKTANTMSQQESFGRSADSLRYDISKKHGCAEPYHQGEKAALTVSFYQVLQKLFQHLHECSLATTAIQTNDNDAEACTITTPGLDVQSLQYDLLLVLTAKIPWTQVNITELQGYCQLLLKKVGYSHTKTTPTVSCSSSFETSYALQILYVLVKHLLSWSWTKMPPPTQKTIGNLLVQTWHTLCVENPPSQDDSRAIAVLVEERHTILQTSRLIFFSLLSEFCHHPIIPHLLEISTQAVLNYHLKHNMSQMITAIQGLNEERTRVETTHHHASPPSLHHSKLILTALNWRNACHLLGLWIEHLSPSLLQPSILAVVWQTCVESLIQLYSIPLSVLDECAKTVSSSELDSSNSFSNDSGRPRFHPREVVSGAFAALTCHFIHKHSFSTWCHLIQRLDKSKSPEQSVLAQEIYQAAVLPGIVHITHYDLQMVILRIVASPSFLLHPQLPPWVQPKEVWQNMLTLAKSPSTFHFLSFCHLTDTWPVYFSENSFPPHLLGSSSLSVLPHWASFTFKAYPLPSMPDEDTTKICLFQSLLPSIAKHFQFPPEQIAQIEESLSC